VPVHYTRTKLFAPPLKGGGERLQISAGTESFRTRERPQQSSYAPAAIVPAGPWRRPTPSEREAINADWHGADNAVSILTLYDMDTIISLQSSVNRLHLTQRQAPVEPDNPFLLEVAARLEELGCRMNLITYYPLVADPVGLETVSKDAASGHLVGLHVDAWKDVHPGATGSLPRRMCLNLGTQPRYFLYIDRPVCQMHALLGRSIQRSSSSPEVGRAFMETFPSYPVMKVRIDPGEAYLATTDQMVHDGCSVGQISPVLHTAFRGHFFFREDCR